MSDENRRWKEYNVLSLPTEEIKKRRKMVKNFVIVGGSISFITMIIGAIIVVKAAINYHSMTAVWISLFGAIIVSIIGLLLAYRIGNRAGKNYEIYMERYYE